MTVIPYNLPESGVRINSHNEWDKLRSVVVGTASGANWPMFDPTFAVNWETTLFKEMPHPKGRVSAHVIDEANEDLEDLAAALRSAGITVHRPLEHDYTKMLRTPKWDSDQMYGYCPRDTHLVVGNTVIEAPMSYRSRQFEADQLSHVRREAILHGANWLAAPRPCLAMGTHDATLDQVKLAEVEPIFDAANCLRLNQDILYLKSCTGNSLGAKWLQRVLGDDYKIHVLEDVYAYAHIDSTISPIREGLVVLNAKRVNEDNMPAIFEKWDKIWFDTPVTTSYYQYPYASAFIGMNLLMIDPQTAIVDKNQKFLIADLESKGIEVWALELRHARTLGGGFHCVTLDLERE